MSDVKEEWSVTAVHKENRDWSMGYFTDHEPTEKELQDWIEWQQLQNYNITVSKVYGLRSN